MGSYLEIISISLGHEGGALMMGLMPLYKKEETGDLFNMLRIQLEGAHLQARERAPTKTQLSQHLDLGLPSLQNCEK